MNNTEKLCNFRDCTTGNFEPCPYNAVDPCKVFRHADSGHWYDEITGQPIHSFRKEDGKMFDVQLWLEAQIITAAKDWKWGNKVHEEYRSKELRPSKPSRRGAEASPYSKQELDAIANAFIRNKQPRRELIEEIKESGLELHGLIRMQKKWGDNPILALRVAELQQRRDALRQVQSSMDKGSTRARNHLKNDDEWTNRWQAKRGRWNDFVLMCEYDERLFVIDRHGLKMDGQYLYLPKEDSKHFESALLAEAQYGIYRGRWRRMAVPTEKIGASMRRYGKKNANGRRINARADQTKYAGTVEDIIEAMRGMNMSVLRIQHDDDLFKYYLEKVAPVLNRG